MNIVKIISNENKGIIGYQDITKGGYSLMVVNFRNKHKEGDKLDVNDINRIESAIHFEDRGSMQRVVDCLNDMLEKWRE